MMKMCEKMMQLTSAGIRIWYCLISLIGLTSTAASSDVFSKPLTLWKNVWPFLGNVIMSLKSKNKCRNFWRQLSFFVVLYCAIFVENSSPVVSGLENHLEHFYQFGPRVHTHSQSIVRSSISLCWVLEAHTHPIF